MTSSLASPAGQSRRAQVVGEVGRVVFVLVVGAVFFGATASVTSVGPEGRQVASDKAQWLLVAGALALVVSIVVMLLRHRHPVLTTALLALLTIPTGAAAGAAIVGLTSLATRRRWVEITAMFVPWVLAGYLGEVVTAAALNEVVAEKMDSPDISSQVAWALVFVACVGVGLYVGERRALIEALRERVLTTEREQALRVAQAQLAERNRIAREMHDVLAHRISLVAMHSGALAFRTDLPPEQVAETAELIRSNANQALTELRSVLGVMRGATSAPDADGVEPPQPTLADLPALVADARGSVTLTMHGDPAHVPEATSRHAYRIAQECVTNARKHAPGEPVTLEVSVRPSHGTWWAGAGTGGGTLEITARNRVAAESAPLVPGAGLGLIGLAERAVIAGGELTHGVDRAGTFVVHARIPWS